MAARVSLDAGSGGCASQRLINDIFLRNFDNEFLRLQDDGARLPPIRGEMAFSADSFTVTPLFFPGGSIGALAVNGTVNDVAMMGAEPKYLSCAFIIEEGLELEVLERVAADMARACAEAGVKIVTGDTKVTPKGACDKLFITTSGIGEIYASPPPSGYAARPGDVLIVSGTMGDHGFAIMACRESLSFSADARSDCAPLNTLVRDIIQAGGASALRDPTRGGLATTLNEIARQSQCGVELIEEAIPINPAVADGCSFLGLDPLYLANEGKLICAVPKERAERVLAAMRANKHGLGAAIIGEVKAENPGKVWARTKIGGRRFLGMLEGAQLPRIC